MTETGIESLQALANSAGLVVATLKRRRGRDQFTILHGKRGRRLAVVNGVRPARQWIEGYMIARAIALAMVRKHDDPAAKRIRAAFGLERFVD